MTSVGHHEVDCTFQNSSNQPSKQLVSSSSSPRSFVHLQDWFSECYQQTVAINLSPHSSDQEKYFLLSHHVSKTPLFPLQRVQEVPPSVQLVPCETRGAGGKAVPQLAHLFKMCRRETFPTCASQSKKKYAIHSHLSTELSNQLSYTVSGLAVGDRGPLQSAPVANLCQDAPELKNKM